MFEQLLNLDKSLFLFLNRDLSNPFFDVFFVTVTNARFWIIPAAIAIVIYLKLEKKKAAFVILLSLITVAISDPLAVRVIKPLVHRLRPCHPDALVEGGRFLIGHKTSLSFPSAHACNVSAQAMLFSLIYRRYTIFFFLFAAIIGFSRIFTGVHYPLDVLGGTVIGISVGLFVYALASHFSQKYQIFPELFLKKTDQPPILK